MKLSLSFDLNQEQSDALQDRVDLYNEGSGLPAITTAEFLKLAQIEPYIQTLVTQRYEASLTRLGVAASALPYAERKALIETIQSKLP